MKKGKTFSLLLLTALFSLPFISAQIYGFSSVKDIVMRTIDSVLSILSPFFEVLIGNYATSEFFFAKILLLFLLIIICKYVLDKTPIGEGNGKISLLIATIVSILAIRFISDTDLIQGILIPYGTLGIAISTIVPLLIFFYFIHNSNVGPAGRKFFWAMFIIILLVLWGSKSSQIGQTANQIYGLTILAALLIVIFDKSVHSYFGMGELKKHEREGNKRRIREAKKELDEVEEHFEKRRISWADYKEEKKRLEDYIKELSKE